MPIGTKWCHCKPPKLCKFPFTSQCLHMTPIKLTQVSICFTSTRSNFCRD